MNTMTAYNEDVQAYTARPNKKVKNEIMKEVKEISLQKGMNFNSLFPAGTKRHQVLDEIIYLLSGGGITTAQAKTIATKVGTSISTVNIAVKHLKELDLFIVAGLADGSNKYIFVYKNHVNYQSILNDVFYVSEIDSITEPITELVLEPRSLEVVDTTSVTDDKTDSISINLLDLKELKDLKQEIHNNVREDIEDDIVRKDVKEFKQHINFAQYNLYEQLKDDILDPRIRESAKRIALRAGSNFNLGLLNIAMKAVRMIDRALFKGVEIESIPAYFDKIYRDRLTYQEYNSGNVKTIPAKRDVSFYYDWLSESDL